MSNRKLTRQTCESVDFEALISLFQSTHQELQNRATQAVNRSLVIRNWLFGRVRIQQTVSVELTQEPSNREFEAKQNNWRVRKLGLQINTACIAQRAAQKLPVASATGNRAASHLSPEGDTVVTFKLNCVALRPWDRLTFNHRWLTPPASSVSASGLSDSKYQLYLSSKEGLKRELERFEAELGQVGDE